MNRRNFISMMLGAAAGTVAAQYGLLEVECVNRVYSFPSQIRIASEEEVVMLVKQRMDDAIRILQEALWRDVFLYGHGQVKFYGGDEIRQPFIYSS